MYVTWIEDIAKAIIFQKILSLAINSNDTTYPYRFALYVMSPTGFSSFSTPALKNQRGHSLSIYTHKTYKYNMCVIRLTVLNIHHLTEYHSMTNIRHENRKYDKINHYSMWAHIVRKWYHYILINYCDCEIIFFLFFTFWKDWSHFIDHLLSFFPIFFSFYFFWPIEKIGHILLIIF